MHRPCHIVFICTGNAGRSQLAAALCEHLGGERVSVRSAGVQPWDQLHPIAVQMMRERGWDVTGRHPKPVAAVLDRVNDLVVTIGDPARNQRPDPMPGEPRIIHWDIADPADADGTTQSEAVFRETLAAIEARMPDLLALAAELTRPTRVRRRPGVTTGVWYPDPFEPAVHLPRAVAAGFCSIELNCFLGEGHFPFRQPQAIGELRRVADDLGVEVWSIHEPSHPVAPGALDATARQGALDDLKLSIDLAAQLGATAIPSHALAHPQYADPTTANRRVAVEQLSALAPMARASGVRIAIENGYPVTQPTLDAFDQLPTEAFGFVIDTGHAHIAGGQSEIGRVIRHVGRRMISLHLNDNDGQHDSHHPPGGGGIDWPAVVQDLEAIDYQGCLLWEVFARLGGRTDDPDEVLRHTCLSSRALFAGR